MEDGRRQELADCEIYVKQSGFYGATVNPDSKKPKDKTRLEELEAKGIEPEFPEVEPQARYYIDLLFKIGPFSSFGMGGGPMCDADLFYWQRTRGYRLSPDDCEILIRLARVYVSSLKEGEYPSSQAPYASDDEEVKQRKRDALAKFIDRAMR